MYSQGRPSICRMGACAPIYIYVCVCVYLNSDHGFFDCYYFYQTKEFVRRLFFIIFFLVG